MKKKTVASLIKLRKKKESCKFDKVVKENLWEFHETCKYVHQILLIANKDKVGNQRRCWRYRRANFAGKLSDSV